MEEVEGGGGAVIVAGLLLLGSRLESERAHSLLQLISFEEWKFLGRAWTKEVREEDKSACRLG